jgi:hypothetical protein
VLALLSTPAPARAQADLFSPGTLSGRVDLRLGAANGERSWVEGGFGKTRLNGDGGDYRLQASLAQGAVEWKPSLGWDWTAVVSAEVQPDQHRALDFGEAYVRYKPVPRSDLKLSVRAGLFYPPVSLEHDGPAWSVTRTITPSAINSWIGEEVKLIGAEGSVRRSFGAHELGATAAVFGYNDTAGTLLSFRGWSLNDVQATPNNVYPLPPLSPFLKVRQAPVTQPVMELDKRAGYYLRLDWRPPAPVAFNAVYLDNLGDKVAVHELQWSWKTRFLNLGANWAVDDNTEVLSQAMIGETLMGYPMPAGIWVDLDYSSAFLLATRHFGSHAVTGRVEYFRTHDRAPQYGDNGENGWALTGAWRATLSAHAELVFEALHVASDRPTRLLAGLSPMQDQTTLQASARFTY